MYIWNQRMWIIIFEELDAMFCCMENMKQLIMDTDPNNKQNIQVHQNLENNIKCYRQIFEEKKTEMNEISF